MSAPTRLCIKILLLCTSLLLALGIVEGYLRISRRDAAFNAATELPWMRNNSGDLSQYFTVDRDIGFRPILGAGGYSEYGTFTNSYPLEKRAGIARVLFIGDSVTARGKIIDAIRKIYGDAKYEYWNAGVESFNTIQEVKYYLRYNQAIQPDHVILTFHLNDFELTPVAYFNEKKQLVVYIPHTPLKAVNRWLFEKSYLYRLIVGLTLRPASGRHAVVQEIQQNLQLLRDTLGERHIRLTILIHPLLKPPEQWLPAERYARKKIIGMARRLEIPYFDLFEPYSTLVTAAAEIQTKSGDTWHPTPETAAVFADYLARHRLLED